MTLSVTTELVVEQNTPVGSVFGVVLFAKVTVLAAAEPTFTVIESVPELYDALVTIMLLKMAVQPADWSAVDQ